MSHKEKPVEIHPEDGNSFVGIYGEVNVLITDNENARMNQ